MDVDAIDWMQVKGWSKVRYDPNRLIHGAQEEGFVELEEISMKDIDFSALTPKPAAASAPKRAASAAAPTRAPVDVDAIDWTEVKGWSKVRYDPNRLIHGAQEAGFVELEEISMKDIDFGSGRSSGGKDKGAGKGAGKGKGKGAFAPRWTSRSSRRWTSPRTTTTTATSTRTSFPSAAAPTMTTRPN